MRPETEAERVKIDWRQENRRKSDRKREPNATGNKRWTGPEIEAGRDRKSKPEETGSSETEAGPRRQFRVHFSGMDSVTIRLSRYPLF